MISFFLSFERPGEPQARVGEAELSRFAAILKRAPGLEKALLFTPERAHDPYLDDGPPPILAAQLYFAEIAALEAALARRGPLQPLADAGEIPSLAGAQATQQAMLARIFPVPDPQPRTPAGGFPCSYLVAYEGAAQDPDLWLAYYLEHHPPLMARLPGVREIEIYTRLDWCGFLPFRRALHLQRNKVAFDDKAALDAALDSPARHEMRADFAKFPPFDGRVSHYAMATRRLLP
ncbi:MAG TPA: EthD family reductase [Stellaceae bacterium]|nr:EthD family reductase [Stellaceae bacterium]